MSRKSIACLVLGLVLALGLFLTQALAADKPKDFPTRPVTIQVGFGAGGSSDVGVRVLAEALKKVIGQPVLTENKPGAGGQVMWTDFKNNAKPDGYTLALVNIPQLQTIVFDPARKSLFTMKDFQPVANHVQDPGAILVRKESPYKTLEDLLTTPRPARPGESLDHGDRERRPPGGARLRGGRTSASISSICRIPRGPHSGPGRPYRCGFRQRGRLPAVGEVRPGTDPGSDDGAAVP